jgi:hypothetical protein
VFFFSLWNVSVSLFAILINIYELKNGLNFSNNENYMIETSKLIHETVLKMIICTCVQHPPHPTQRTFEASWHSPGSGEYIVVLRVFKKFGNKE